ncbi:YtpI family protein [Bacillus dakarensis]|uniref:YtpI family protein n=1 Tax=Robertmurraya dakarensis TaxID=1926278 RepID=UPI000980AC28|nr:YtpI family protein [Bacillus dakarensis]
MPILVIIFVLSFAFYIFYKAKYFRTKLPAEKKWVSAKSNIALGLFVGFFGLNQIFLNLSTVGIIVGIVFILLGVFNVWGGIKSYKFFLPLAIEEAEQLKK